MQLIFSDGISSSFGPRFKTISLPYLLDLIIRFSMQLFFLKSCEWSLNLKSSVIISDPTPLFTLNISVDKYWIILSWIVTDFKKFQKEDLLSLWTSLKAHSCNLFIWSLIFLLWHPGESIVAQLRHKTFH